MIERRWIDIERQYKEWQPVSLSRVVQEEAHLKEIVISDCQFEGGLRCIDLHAPQRCEIRNNRFLYGAIGVLATNCHDLRINGNTFTGIQERRFGYGIVANGSLIDPRGNNYEQCDYGAWIEAKSTDALGDHMSLMDGKTSQQNAYTAVNPEVQKLPIAAGGLQKGHSLLGPRSGR